jgi:hypothetical protein
MRMRLLAGVLFVLVLPLSAAGQSIELMFTSSGVQQALWLRSALKLEKDQVRSFGALALAGATPERTREYVDSVAGMTAVIIIGEDALKAASAVEFSVPVIVIEAAGPTAAKDKVIRVFAKASTKAPPTAKSPSIREVAGLLRGRDLALKGDVDEIVQAVLAALTPKS